MTWSQDPIAISIAYGYGLSLSGGNRISEADRHQPNSRRSEEAELLCSKQQPLTESVTMPRQQPRRPGTPIVTGPMRPGPSSRSFRSSRRVSSARSQFTWQ
jgi:hypothetical protein